MADSDSMTQEKILAFLVARAGSIEDPSGRGLTAELAEAIGYHKPAALNILLGQMESDGVITRDVRGLRTYRIALTADRPAAVATSTRRVATNRTTAANRSLRDPIADPATNGTAPEVDWRSLADEPPAGNQVAPRTNGTRARRIARPGAAAGYRTADPTDPAPDPDADPVSRADAWRHLDPAESSSSDRADAWRNTDPAVRPAVARTRGPARGTGPEAETAAGRTGASWRDRDPADSWRNIAPAAPADAGTTSARRFDGRDSTTDRFSALASAPPAGEEPDDHPSPRPTWAERSAPARRHWWVIEIPELRTAPSNTILAIVGVTMAVLVITTLIAVFTAGRSGPTTVADNANSTIDSCTLVTSQEVSIAFKSDAKDPHRVLGSCVFDNGLHQLIVDAADNRARARFDTAKGDSAQDVAGVGDSAYYSNGRLGVLKGSRMVLMTLVPYSPTAANPALITLAKTVVARL